MGSSSARAFFWQFTLSEPHRVYVWALFRYKFKWSKCQRRKLIFLLSFFFSVGFEHILQVHQSLMNISCISSSFGVVCVCVCSLFFLGARVYSNTDSMALSHILFYKDLIFGVAIPRRTLTQTIRKLRHGIKYVAYSQISLWLPVCACLYLNGRSLDSSGLSFSMTWHMHVVAGNLQTFTKYTNNFGCHPKEEEKGEETLWIERKNGQNTMSIPMNLWGKPAPHDEQIYCENVEQYSAEQYADEKAKTSQTKQC